MSDRLTDEQVAEWRDTCLNMNYPAHAAALDELLGHRSNYRDIAEITAEWAGWRSGDDPPEGWEIQVAPI